MATKGPKDGSLSPWETRVVSVRGLCREVAQHPWRPWVFDDMPKGLVFSVRVLSPRTVRGRKGCLAMCSRAVLVVVADVVCSTAVAASGDSVAPTMAMGSQRRGKARPWRRVADGISVELPRRLATAPASACACSVDA
jgi:hypothetical protein